MARSTRTSLVGQAASAARKVVGRRSPSDGANGREPASGRTGAAPAGSTSRSAKATRPAPAGETSKSSRTGKPAKAAKSAGPAAAKATTEGPATKVSAAKARPSRAPSQKAATSTTAAKKTATTKTATTKAATKKAATTKPPAKKAAATKAAATKKAATKKAATKKASKAPAKKAGAKQAAPASRGVTAAKAPVSRLVVKEDEQAWTHDELQEVLAELTEQRDHSAIIVRQQEADLSGLMRDSGDGAGQDQADLGATSFERDHELTVLNNEREKLAQIDRALGRIEDGSYGVCESCGNAIGKMRLMAFPRATLCMTCKQRDERRGR